MSIVKAIATITEVVPISGSTSTRAAPIVTGEVHTTSCFQLLSSSWWF